jgi:nucleoside-diphosphate-sugar epimerase
MMNYDALREQVRGCQMVVHLAAYASPLQVPGHEVFQSNVVGTFNVFEAAAAEGIKRVVQASSINAFGCTYSITDMRIQYFPIDEAHPTYTTDSYSISKQMVEDIGAYYWRRAGISSVAMRWPAVYVGEMRTNEERQQRRTEMRQHLDEFVTLPQDEQAAYLAQARKDTLVYRERRMMEYEGRTAAQTQNQAPFSGDWLWQAYNSDRFNFWAYIDGRDAAQAVEKALTAAYEGSHPLFVNHDHNALDYDTKTLIRLFFPEVSQFKHPIQGSEALVSIEQARTLIGFEPEYTL